MLYSLQSNVEELRHVSHMRCELGLKGAVLIVNILLDQATFSGNIYPNRLGPIHSVLNSTTIHLPLYPSLYVLARWLVLD